MSELLLQITLKYKWKKINVHTSSEYRLMRNENPTLYCALKPHQTGWLDLAHSDAD